jgi:hypothetical protein
VLKVTRDVLTVKIRIFDNDVLDLPELKLGVLKLLEERVLEASGDPIDVLMRISEEESRSKKGSYIEIEVKSLSATYILGESPRYKWRRKLTFKPERLLRVGILQKKPDKPISMMSFKLNDVKWYEVPRDERIYVFEGNIDLKTDDVFLIILDTEEGRSYIRPVSSLRLRKSSQTPQ